MAFNPHTHNRKSIRLQGYNYANDGFYFVTICTHNRECLFGNINDNKMELNDAGIWTKQCWEGIPNHFPNTVLHDFIVMPNHVHGIIEIKNTLLSTAMAENISQIHQLHSIGSIIKGFKIGVTKWFRNNHQEFNSNKQPIWQRNYYEHIIRNEHSYLTISDYIVNNPSKWNDDKFFV